MKELAQNLYTRIFRTITFDDIATINSEFWAGNYFYFGIAIVAFMLLMMNRKRWKEAHKALTSYILLLLCLLLYNPVTYYILVNKLGAFSEWQETVRFWILFPGWIMIAYVLAETIGSVQKFWKRALAVIVAVCLMTSWGTSLMDLDYIYGSSNAYKINQNAKLIADSILELSDGEATSARYVDLDTNYSGKFQNGGSIPEGITQYTADIFMSSVLYTQEQWDTYIAPETVTEDVTPAQYVNSNLIGVQRYYCRYFIIRNEETLISLFEENGFTFDCVAGDFAILSYELDFKTMAADFSSYVGEGDLVACSTMGLVTAMNGACDAEMYMTFDAGEGILQKAVKYSADYVLNVDGYISEAVMNKYGFTKVVTSGVCSLWKNDFSSSNVWTVTQYASTTENQASFYTITDQQGHVVVIDGGWTEDAEYVLEVINNLGGHVDAWILTHPHFDHIRAFNAIYASDDCPEIDVIYASEFDWDQYHEEAAEWDQIADFETFYELAQDMDNLVYLHAGDELDLIGLDMQVFHDYTSKVGGDAANDGSLVFKVSTEKLSMLFCADTGVSQSDVIIEKYGDELSSDYLQMGHHGNGGLSAEFYTLVSPSVSFFDAPDWLMYPAEGTTYTTAENIALMQSLGSAIRYWGTAPNRVFLY